jgi:hypothetical protein
MKNYILFTVLLLSHLAIAQKKKYSFEELDDLGKDSVVQLAKTYITSKDFKPQVFDKIQIRKKDNVTEKHYYVSFKPSVLYLPMRHLFYSSVTVDLLSGSTSHTIESRGRNYKWEAPYYQQSRRAKKAIRFILNALEKRGEGSQLDLRSKSIAVVIHARLLYYQVESNSSSTYLF